MKNTNPLVMVFAFLFLLLLLAGLAARFWASDREYSFTGPTHIAAGAESVYLFASGDIYQLSLVGELLGVTSQDRSGLHDDPIDLVVLADGELLVAEQNPALIRICNTQNWICRSEGTQKIGGIKRQLKVISGLAAGEFLISDARGDTLWKLSGESGELMRLVPENTLAGPNGLILDDDKHLWIADTDNRRIVELLPSADDSYETGREHSAVNEKTIGRRFYPMMLTRGKDNRLWVTQAAEFSEGQSDLVIYHPENGVEAVVDLPDGAFATDVVALEDSVLVSDMDRFAVYQVSAATLTLSEFGDDKFRLRMSGLAEQKAYYGRLSTISLAIIILAGVLMIPAAILATPREKRWTQPRAIIDLDKAPQEVPSFKGTYWLERNHKMDRSITWLKYGFFIVYFLEIIASLLLFAWMKSQSAAASAEQLASASNQVGLVLLLAALVITSMVPSIIFSTQAMKRSLGTDGKRIFLRLGDGRSLSVEPSRLAFNDRIILYRHYSMPLRAGQMNLLYAPGEIEKWLGPLLRQSTRLSEFEVIKYQLKNRDGLLFWPLGSMAVMALVALVVTLLRF